MKQSVRDISHSFFKALMQNITTERHSYLIKTQTSFMLFVNELNNIQHVNIVCFSPGMWLQCASIVRTQFYIGVKVNGYVRNSILTYYLCCIYLSRWHTHFLYALNTQMTYYNCTLCWIPYPTMQCIDLTFHVQCDVRSNCDDSFDQSHEILVFSLKSECLIPIFIQVTEVMLKTFSFCILSHP